MAVKHAVFLYNHLPDPATGLSPHDVFTKTRWPLKNLHNLHVWGCPVYVLDKKISDGKKLPRWKPRSERQKMMGLSDTHATTAPLVLNFSSGSITPQFHVMFDDWFATVQSTVGEIPDFTQDEWYKLFGDSTYQYHSADEQDDTDSNKPETSAAINQQNRQDEIMRAMDQKRETGRSSMSSTIRPPAAIRPSMAPSPDSSTPIVPFAEPSAPSATVSDDTSASIDPLKTAPYAESPSREPRPMDPQVHQREEKSTTPSSKPSHPTKTSSALPFVEPR